jgi:hypothetical protein
MKYRLGYGVSILEVLDDNALQQRGSHARIPDAFRINDDDRTFGAHTEAWCLAAFHPLWSEEKIFPLQQLSEQRINLAAAPVGAAKIAGAHEDVP